MFSKLLSVSAVLACKSTTGSVALRLRSGMTTVFNGSHGHKQVPSAVMSFSSDAGLGTIGCLNKASHKQAAVPLKERKIIAKKAMKDRIEAKDKYIQTWITGLKSFPGLDKDELRSLSTDSVSSRKFVDLEKALRSTDLKTQSFMNSTTSTAWHRFRTDRKDIILRLGALGEMTRRFSVGVQARERSNPANTSARRCRKPQRGGPGDFGTEHR